SQFHRLWRGTGSGEPAFHSLSLFPPRRYITIHAVPGIPGHCRKSSLRDHSLYQGPEPPEDISNLLNLSIHCGPSTWGPRLLHKDSTDKKDDIHLYIRKIRWGH